MQVKNNLVKSLLFSIAISALSAIGFGFLYYFGFEVYWVCAVQTILAAIFFFIFIKKPNFAHFVLCLLWCAIWVFVFNFVAILLSETIFILINAGYSFKESFISVLNMWKADFRVKEFFMGKIYDIALYSGFGSALSIAYLVIVCVSKTKKTKTQKTRIRKEEIASAPQVVVADNSLFDDSNPQYLSVYNKALNLLKDALLEYLQTNNNAIVQNKKQYVYQNILKSQSPATKQLISTYAQKQLNKNLSKIDEKANKIITELL